ncbi:MAG: LapA family protein [Pseudomonadota bacterium]
MRSLRAFLAIVFLVVGLVLGVLNAEPATVDLGAIEVRAGLGVILLCTLLAGVLIGGLAIAISVAMPLRRELRRARAVGPGSAASDATASGATPTSSGTGDAGASVPSLPEP